MKQQVREYVKDQLTAASEIRIIGERLKKHEEALIKIHFNAAPAKFHEFLKQENVVARLLQHGNITEKYPLSVDRSLYGLGHTAGVLVLAMRELEGAWQGAVKIAVTKHSSQNIWINFAIKLSD